jgi:hypothetical protein
MNQSELVVHQKKLSLKDIGFLQKMSKDTNGNLAFSTKFLIQHGQQYQKRTSIVYSFHPMIGNMVQMKATRTTTHETMVHFPT